MTTKMTRAMRMELANAIRDRYATASNKDKHRILEEFVAATGYHAKSAIHYPSIAGVDRLGLKLGNCEESVVRATATTPSNLQKFSNDCAFYI